MLINAIGIERDLVSKKVWLERASTQGHEGAQDALKQLNNIIEQNGAENE